VPGLMLIRESVVEFCAYTKLTQKATQRSSHINANNPKEEDIIMRIRVI
jgi:hypothetical protein